MTLLLTSFYVSSELRTGADGYTDILSTGEDIWGNSLKHREQKDNSSK
jgi:hypothetical protein